MSILVLRSSWWGREKAVCLLSLSSWCLVIVVWLFLSVPWVCLQFVIVILTYYFWVSFMRTGMALAIYTFAWASLSLRHSSKFSCGDSNGDWMQFCASSEGSGESAHFGRQSLDNVINIKISCAVRKGSARLHRLAWAFFTVSKYHVLNEMAIFVTFMWTVNDVVILHQHPQDFCATISALYQCVKNAPSAL